MSTDSHEEPGGDQELIGTVLAGRYRIVRKLGEGAMGAVYLGEHLRIGRHDAIKVLRNAVAGDTETIARFVRGARILSSIHHPNVCTIYDFSDTDDGVRFLAMELVSGEALKDVLDREGVLPLGRALPIAMQAASALQAAHDGDVVHRDLKPANIMIVQGKGGADVVKVVDFDIAKGPQEVEGTEVTRLGFVVGTPEYMSPEQLVGERLDGRSDLYSLGLVIFRMLTGALPFRASGLQDLMVERLTQTPLTLAEVRPEGEFPPRLQQVLARALARRAEERYANAAELERELAAVLGEATGGLPGLSATGVSAAPAAPLADVLPQTQVVSSATGAGGIAPATAAPPIPAARGSRTAPLIGVAALVLLLGGAGGVWLLRGGSAPAPPADPLSSAVQPSEPGLALVDEPGASGAAGTAGAVQPDAARPDPAPQQEPRQPEQQPDRASPTPAPAPAAAPALDPATVGDLLMRQFDRLNSGAQGARELRTIGDSARLVYNTGTVRTLDRALAAYVVANTAVARHDTTEVVLWLRRALELRPGYAPYQNLLDVYRRTGP